MAPHKQVVLLKSCVSNRGGLEKYASRIADCFLKKGCNVTLITQGAAPVIDSIRVFAAKTWSWPAFIRMEQYDRFVNQWLNGNRADLIFGMDRNRMQTHLRAGNGVHAAFLQSRILTEGRLKWLICQANPLHRKILELEKDAFENPRLQKLFTNSHMVKRQILERYSTPSSKIEVVHNGVEWHEMQSGFDAWEMEKPLIAKRLGLDPFRFHFLFIGNGYLRKGLGQLLKALARLKSKDFTLSVVGKDTHWEEYRALADRLHLKDQVVFFGPQKETRPFYQMADALVIPSFYDPFANVTIEALAMGLFTISSKTNGGHEILTQNNGAVIEELTDADALAATLETAWMRPKTTESARQIRESVRHLDFSHQMPFLIDASLC